MRTRARILGILFVVGLIGIFLAVPALPLAVAPAEQLTNGNFESRFDARGVAAGWQAFALSAEGVATWEAEKQEPLLWDGRQGQRICLPARGDSPTEGPLYAGVWQNLPASPGKAYWLTLHGAIQTDDEMPENSLGVQWGVADRPAGNWRDVSAWIDIPWKPTSPSDTPATMESYRTAIVARSGQLTLVIRLWRSGQAAGEPACLSLDGLSLRSAETLPAYDSPLANGPVVSITAPAYPLVGTPARLRVTATSETGLKYVKLFDDDREIGRWEPPMGMPALEEVVIWIPARSGIHTLRAEALDFAGVARLAWQPTTVGENAELLADHIAHRTTRGWVAFQKGDPSTANERRLPRQLGGGDRIRRQVDGLRAGTQYTLTALAAANAAHSGLRCALWVGLDWNGGTDDHIVSEWIPLLLSPGDLQTHQARMVARGSTATIFLKAPECQVTLDKVSLRGYQ